MSVAERESVDLVGPDAVRDPHATFADLRKRGPVHWLERHRAWLLLDYELVRLALTDGRLTTDTITPLYEKLSADERERYRSAERLLRGWMIFNDPPAHTSLREPVRSAFTPKAVAALQGEIAALTDSLLDELSEGFDFVSSVAFPLPATVIAILLGVPADHHVEMREWSTNLGALVMGKTSRQDAWERAVLAADDMQAYFSDLIRFYRDHPADNLISKMVHDTPSVGVLTHEQLVGACSLLLFAGHDTTTSLLTSGIYHLLRNPDARRRLVSEPGLSASAVEEVLRYDGPSKVVVRRARSTGDWEGYPFRAGQPVFCAVMAANRDRALFEDPNDLVIDRQPNRHLGFGWGMHFCLGAQLARLEAQTVIPRVLQRFPRMEIACDPTNLSWHPTIVGRTLRALPVSVS